MSTLWLCVLCLFPCSVWSQTWNIAGWRGGAPFVSFNGTMQIPRLPQPGGTPYVWPGLQPQTGGVLQQVCDGRKGAWWIGSGYYGTPSLPWGAGISVAPGNKVRYTNVVNTAGTWTSSVQLVGGSAPPAVSTFALPGIDMVVALFANELYGVPWTFGPVHYTDITLQNNDASTWWCQAPYWITGANIYVKGFTPSVVNGKGTCHIDQVSLLSPPNPTLVTPVKTYSRYAALPLDVSATGSSAAAVFSLRKLRNAWTGGAIRVQRSSDNTQQDIGFVDNVLDVTGLLSFVGTGDGRVVTWYDQSGKNNHATQPVATAPFIVQAGVIKRMPNTGLPAIYFDGTDYLQLSSYPFATSRTIAFYGVTQQATNDNWQRVWDFGKDGNQYIFLSGTGQGTPRFRITNNGNGAEQGTIGTAAVLTSAHIIQAHHTGTTTSLTVDGTTVGPTTGITILPSTLSGATTNYIGKSQFSDPLYNGYMSELLFFNQDITGTAHTTLLDNINRAYLPTLVNAPATLDATTISSNGAFSLRRLSTTYTGPAIQLRRSSDGTTKDIGFLPNGDLDIATAKTFVSSGDGFVTIWYDQGPSGNHARQDILELQPTLYIAGKINQLNNGKPTIRFDTKKYQWLYISSYPFTSTSSYTNQGSSSIAYIVSQPVTSANWQRIFDFGYDTNQYTFATPSADKSNPAVLYGIATQGNTNQQNAFNTPAHVGSPSLSIYQHSGTSISVTLNGALIASSPATILPSALNGATRNFIGRSQYWQDEYLDAYVSEMIFYGQNVNADGIVNQHVGITNNINNYWGFTTTPSPTNAPTSTPTPTPAPTPAPQWVSFANSDVFTGQDAGSITGTVATAQSTAMTNHWNGFVLCGSIAYFKAGTASAIINAKVAKTGCTLYVLQ